MEFSAPLEIAGLAKLSPNGQLLAHLHNNSILIRETDGLRAEITLPSSEPLSRVEWAPNSALVFGVSARRPVVLVRVLR